MVDISIVHLRVDINQQTQVGVGTTLRSFFFFFNKVVE
jgi:hypothetical protein